MKKVIVPQGIPYLPFLCWIGLWSMVMHFAIAIFNGVVFLKYVTRFSCDVFGFFVCCVYIQKGVQVYSPLFPLKVFSVGHGLTEAGSCIPICGGSGERISFYRHVAIGFDRGHELSGDWDVEAISPYRTDITYGLRDDHDDCVFYGFSAFWRRVGEYRSVGFAHESIFSDDHGPGMVGGFLEYWCGVCISGHSVCRFTHDSVLHGS